MREYLRGRYLPRKRLLAKPGKCKHFIQFRVLAIACLCSYESITDICFDGISLESREILFLNKTFPRLRNGDIEIYSQEIGDYFWDAADIVGEAFSE